MRSEELKQSIRRLRGPEQKPLDLSPTSPFEALLDQRIKDMERHVEELKGRINGLIFVIVGTVIAQVVLSLVR